MFELIFGNSFEVIKVVIEILGLIINGLIFIALIVHGIMFWLQVDTLKGTVREMKIDRDSREAFEKTKSRARIAVTLEDILIERGREVPMYEGGWGQSKERITLPDEWVRWFKGGVYPDGATDVAITPTIRNIGESSATSVEFHGEIIHHVGMSVILTDNYRVPDFSRTITLLHSERHSPQPSLDSLNSIVATDLKSKSTNTLCFCGRVKFKDIFGDKWTQLFAWDIVWTDPEKDPVFRKANDWNYEYKGWDNPPKKA